MPEPTPTDEEGTATADARYDFSFGPDTPYAHAMSLVEQWRAPDGEVLVDLGCGFGAIAEPAQALGLTYLGLDREPSGIRSLQERGAEAVVADLSTPGALVAKVTESLRGRRVAAFTMLDYAEHVPDAADVLSALSDLACSTGGAPLVVSIPNVSHRDLAAKILLGRWDVTPTGLLDETHVRFFAPSTLERQMCESGWKELDARDFPLELSDQHFPEDCVALLPWTPVGALLQRIRAQAAPGATTNQFVRAYRPLAPGEASAMAAAPMATAPLATAPLLSVVVRSRGSDAGLQSTLRALERQEHGTVEVTVVGDEAESRDEVDRAIAGTGGRYVVLLTEGDEPAPGWSRMVGEAARVHPGRVLRVGVEGARSPGPSSLIEVLAEEPVSFAPFALPRSLFADMGARVSAETSVPGEWHLLVRAVELCGMVPLDGIGFTGVHEADPNRTGAARRASLYAALDREPLILDRGAATTVATLQRRLAAVELARADAEHRLSELRQSTSWRVTAPLRAAIAFRSPRHHR